MAGKIIKTLLIFILLILIAIPGITLDDNQDYYFVRNVIWNGQTKIGTFIDDGLIIITTSNDEDSIDGSIVISENITHPCNLLRKDNLLNIGILETSDLPYNVNSAQVDTSHFVFPGQRIRIISTDEIFETDIIRYNPPNSEWVFPYFDLVSSNRIPESAPVVDMAGNLIGITSLAGSSLIIIPIDVIIQRLDITRNTRFHFSGEIPYRPRNELIINQLSDISVNSEAIFGSVEELTSDADKNIYVIDSEFGKLIKYSPAGDKIRQIYRNSSIILNPVSITFSENEILYILDNGLEAVTIFNKNLTYIGRIDYSDIFEHPGFNPYDILYMDNKLWILSRDNNLYSVALSGRGTDAITVSSNPEISQHLINPDCLTAFGNGLAILEKERKAIIKASVDGNYLGSINVNDRGRPVIDEFTVMSGYGQELLLANAKSGFALRVSDGSNIYQPFRFNLHQTSDYGTVYKVSYEFPGSFFVIYRDRAQICALNFRGDMVYSLNNFEWLEIVTPYEYIETIIEQESPDESEQGEEAVAPGIMEEAEQTVLYTLEPGTPEINHFEMWGIQDFDFLGNTGIIIDQTGNIIVYDVENETTSMPDLESADLHPSLVCLASEDTAVWVDTISRTVFMTNIDDEKLIIEKTASITRGYLSSQIEQPVDIEYHDNVLYLADSMTGKILKFDMELVFIDEFEVAAISGEPVYILDTAITPWNKLLILCERKLLEYTLSGTMQNEISLAENVEYRRFTSVAPLTINTIFVSDTAFNNIRIYDMHGSLHGIIGRLGTDNGEFNFPKYVMIRDNVLYVNDYGNNRISRMSISE